MKLKALIWYQIIVINTMRRNNILWVFVNLVNCLMLILDQQSVASWIDIREFWWANILSQEPKGYIPTHLWRIQRQSLSKFIIHTKFRTCTRTEHIQNMYRTEHIQNMYKKRTFKFIISIVNDYHSSRPRDIYFFFYKKQTN